MLYTSSLSNCGIIYFGRMVMCQFIITGETTHKVEDEIQHAVAGIRYEKVQTMYQWREKRVNPNSLLTS